MESSEEEDDFPSIESIIPQAKVDSLYQSHTEKGIRKLCCELLDLKDAVENLCSNMHTKFLAFLRISEEAVEIKHELIELRKHISTHRILVQDLMTGVCHELDNLTYSNSDVDSYKESEACEVEDILPSQGNDYKTTFLENIDVLLAESDFEKALDALDAEEKNSTELKGLRDNSLGDGSSFKSAFLERKEIVEEYLVRIAEQPSFGFHELKKALSGLTKIGKGPLAHQLLLKFYRSRLQKRIDVFLPSCSFCSKTFPATLSKIIFSTISLATTESGSIFGDNPVYLNRIVHWAEWEIESFVRMVKEHAPSPETLSALCAASICVQASLNYCSMLESQGLQMSNLLLVLLRPYIEEVLELNFRRARKVVLGLAESAESFPLSPQFASLLATFAATTDNMLVESVMRFMHIVEDILQQLTPLFILHFEGNVLGRISHLFDKYMDALIKALPGPSDDDHLPELKEAISFMAETDAEQLAILGIAFMVLDEFLPNAVITIWNRQSEGKELENRSTESVLPNLNTNAELKEWRRHLQHSFDKLRDHFCRQYVLSFIYSREGKTRLNAQIYLGSGEDLFWGSDPRPSLPFQALFAKLQQLAIVAGDVLLAKEKILKILLARLTETVLMWLSDEQEFWDVFEDNSSPLQPLGLHQLILDMHFTVEFSRYVGYPSRNVHQIASAINTRAIEIFTARGIGDLPEDEWFVKTAKAAINKFASGSETSYVDEDHIILHDEVVSVSEDTASSLSTVESTESFASASMGELDSPVYSTDPEG